MIPKHMTEQVQLGMPKQDDGDTLVCGQYLDLPKQCHVFLCGHDLKPPPLLGPMFHMTASGGSVSGSCPCR